MLNFAYVKFDYVKLCYHLCQTLLSPTTSCNLTADLLVSYFQYDTTHCQNESEQRHLTNCEEFEKHFLNIITIMFSLGVTTS